MRTLLLFLLLTFKSFSQDATLEIDQWLTVDLPETYTVSDTLGTVTYGAEVDGGTLVVTKSAPQEPILSWDDQHLLAFYSGFRVGALKQLNGRLTMDEIIGVNGIKSARFAVEVDIDGEKYLRNFIVVYYHDMVYTFQSWQTDNTNTGFSERRKAFFDSIVFIGAEDAMPAASSAFDSPFPFQMGYMFASMFVVPVIALVIVAIIRSRKKNSSGQWL